MPADSMLPVFQTQGPEGQGGWVGRRRQGRRLFQLLPGYLGSLMQWLRLCPSWRGTGSPVVPSWRLAAALLGPLFRAGFRGLCVCPWAPEKPESSVFTCTDRKGPGDYGSGPMRLQADA